MNDYRLRAEHPTHFEVEDSKGVFKVAKAGLDSELVKRIQSFADGGPVGGGAGEDVPPLQLMNVREGDAGTPIAGAGGGAQIEYTPAPPTPGLLKRVTDATGDFLPNLKETVAGMAQSAMSPIDSLTDIGSENNLGGIGENAAAIGGGLKKAATFMAPKTMAKVEGNLAENAAPAATETKPPRAPPPTGAQRVAGRSSASPSRLADAPTTAPDAEAAAMRGQAEVIGRQGAEESTAIKDQMSRMADLEAHRQAMTAQWDAEYKGQLRKYSEAVDRYSNTEIQPDRLWASRTTGDKMLAGIGMMLSAFGPGDVNRSVELIDRAVSQDVEVQKANLERLGKSAGMHQNLLGIMREHFGDEMAAESATREAMTANAQLQLKEVAARYQGPQAQANAAAGIAALQTKRAQWQSEFDLKAKATASDIAKNYAQAAKLGATGGGGGGPTAALTALKRFEKAWQGGGGMFGSISKHFPGDVAWSKDVEAQRTALASEIASSLGKGSGRAAFILKGLPQVGEDQAIGQKKIEALRAAIMAEQGGGGADEGVPSEAP